MKSLRFAAELTAWLAYQVASAIVDATMRTIDYLSRR